MTAALLLGIAQPPFDRLLVPVPLVEQIQHTPALIFCVLQICLSIAFLALWRAAPDYRAFRTLGLFFATVSFNQGWRYLGGEGSAWAIRAITAGVLVETAAEAMQIRNYRWTRILWPLYLFVFICGWLPSMAFVRDWPLASSEVALAILIVQGFRHGNARDRMIATAFSVYSVVRMTISASFQNFTHLRDYVGIGGWRWQLTPITLTLMGGVTLAIFARDLIRDRREKQRLASELEAARAIQQVLIPEEIPITPGFSIQAVYRPFSEVGGDFFQILPVKSGGVLAVIGDVSGKGMPAAMTVSLLVGTVRTLAHYTEGPGEILAAMNQRMLGRSKDGFTTCLILRADRDGSVTMANAGHIAPYVLGKEKPVEGGLPLGLSPGASYAEATFALSENEQLTLVTDGVVEARDKSGSLLGFDRTAALSTQGAEAIAQAAQTFGQNDDITVVTIMRLEPQAHAVSPSAAPALSPSLA